MRNNASIIKIVLLIAVLLLTGGFFYYGQKWYSEKREVMKKEAAEAHQKVFKDYIGMAGKNIDFPQASKSWEEFLGKYGKDLPPQEEGNAKIDWAVTLWPMDPSRAAALFKEVALNKNYPDHVRAHALGGLITHFDELDLRDPGFAKREIFKGGEFEKILAEAGGDESLATRKLSEWSNELQPNVISRYSIARWYAEDLYLKKYTDEGQKNELVDKVNFYISGGDQLLSQYYNDIFPSLRGYSYELKARALYLSGRDAEEVETAFENALKEYGLSPNNFYRARYYGHTRLYYAAFLASQYGLSQKEKIRDTLHPSYKVMISSRELEEHTLLLYTSLLVAARDSRDKNYPKPEFNGKSMELIKKAFPEYGKIIDGLKL